MPKNNKKKKPSLKLRRETLAPLDNRALEATRGGYYIGPPVYGQPQLAAPPPPPPPVDPPQPAIMTSATLCRSQGSNHNRRALVVR